MGLLDDASMRAGHTNRGGANAFCYHPERFLDSYLLSYMLACLRALACVMCLAWMPARWGKDSEGVTHFIQPNRAISYIGVLILITLQLQAKLTTVPRQQQTWDSWIDIMILTLNDN